MRLISLLLLGLFMAGCSLFGEESYYHKQQIAYSKAKDGSGLVVNPPLESTKISDAYVIPPAEKAPIYAETPPPPGSLLAKKEQEESSKNTTSSVKQANSQDNS